MEFKLREFIEKLLPKRKKKIDEDEPSFPLDWADPGVPIVSEVELESVSESSWPPNEVKKGKRFVLGERKIKLAKGMFVFYFLITLWSIKASPYILVVFVPTVLLIWDYIRCNETLRKMGAWSKEEIDDDLDNIASVE